MAKTVKKAKKAKKTAKRTNPAAKRSRSRSIRSIGRDEIGRRQRRRVRRYNLPGLIWQNPTPRPRPSPLDEMMPAIKMVMDMSPMNEDKAKKTLECAELLEKTDPDFAKRLRERAKELLKPKLEGIAEEIKPAIRHLDLD